MMPLSTTTYTLRRASDITDDSSDALEFADILTGIPGNTVYLSGSESVVGGDRERVDARLLVEIPEVERIHYYDHMVDETTGDIWQVAYSRMRTGLGLDHYVLGVYQVVGTARGTRDL